MQKVHHDYDYDDDYDDAADDDCRMITAF